MTRRPALIVLAAVGLASPPARAQATRPAQAPPVNVILPSDPSRDPTADTSRTIFYAGGRPPRDPAVDPLPGDDQVTWRSHTLIHGVAGSDAGYQYAMAVAERATRSATAPVGPPRQAVTTVIGPGAFGGWWGVAGDAPPAPRAARRLSDQFPRAWIGGESGNILSPVLEPAPPAVGIQSRRAVRRRP